MIVKLMSPHGTFTLKGAHAEQSLHDLCVMNRVPVNSISVYREVDGALELVTNIFLPLKQLIRGANALVLRPDRNINYHEVVGREVLTDVAPNDVSEYVFRDDTSAGALLHKGFTSDECKAFVHEHVRGLVQEFSDDLIGKPVVVGVSGGGDSNTLIGALLAAGVTALQPVMIMGIPDWDKGLPRARSICADYGLSLKVVDQDRVGKLLGVKGGRDWVTSFERSYPRTDLEVLGTLAVRVVLSAEARELGARAVVTGLNLEDLLSEGLIRVMQGELPLPFPKRTIDDIDIFYPLYQCPKKIIDGCYPKYALANYEDRYPSILPGRAVVYYLAQSMNSTIPGVEFDLLNGLRRLSKQSRPEEFFADPLLGFSTLGRVSLEDRLRWQRFVGKEQVA